MYNYVCADCGAGQYSTLTHAHTHVNLRVTCTQTRTHENGVLPCLLWVFLRIPIRLGSNCHPCIKGMLQLLPFIFSSIGSLSCINLQAKKDFEGGMYWFHSYLPNPTFDSCDLLNESSPLEEWFQITKSRLSATWRATCWTKCLRSGKISSKSARIYHWL